MNRRTIAIGLTLLLVGLGLAWRLSSPSPSPSPNPNPHPNPNPEPGPEPGPGPRRPTLQPPRPMPPADLTQAEPLEIALPDGTTATGRLWLTSRPDVPLLIALSGPGRDGAPWLPALQALKAQREVSLAVIDGGPEATDVTPVRRKAALDRAQAVAQALRARPSLSTTPLVLLGAEDAAEAVLVLAGRDDTVRAVVALSLQADPSDAALTEAFEQLARRQVLLAWSTGDAALPFGRILAQRLANPRLVVASSQAHGLELLQDPQVRSDLAGWLFAALGPAR